MTDVTLRLSERTAQRFAALLNTVEAHLEFSASEKDTIDQLRWHLEEAHNTNKLRERLAEIQQDREQQ